MAKRYYTVDNKWPPMVIAIVTKMIDYVAGALYKDEYTADPAVALKRLILSDIDSGEDISVGDSVDIFRSTNAKFPFTGYNIGSHVPRMETFNTGAQIGKVYCEDVGDYIAAWPMTLNMPMVSFFARADDYERAYTVMEQEAYSLTKLEVPINIGGIDTSFIIDVSQEIDKGSFAYAFEEHLRVNNIWSMTHQFEIKYHNIVLTNTTIQPTLPGAGGGQGEIGGVGGTDDEGQPLPPVSGNLPIPARLAISTTTPIDLATAIAVGDAIEIVFNKPVNPTSMELAFEILPFASGGFGYSADDKTVTFTPYGALDSATTYKVTVLRTVLDSIEVGLLSDYNFSFTTA